jgi:protein subunit release factor B
MNLTELSVITESKRNALLAKMAALNINPRDIDETFVKGSGKGGQKINKTANAVQLVYAPLNITVRMQKERERSVNRFLALRELLEEIVLRISPQTSERKKAWDKIRKQKQRRGRRSSV